MTRAEYEACQARDENGFRAAIETITRRGLQTGLATLDYKVLVADEWRRGNIDNVIDREVDRAIAEVRDETSWFKLWSSLASRERAQELATTAAERVYRSEPMKKAIEALATGLGKEIGKRIELATVDTAGSATQCMQAFLGRRYGTTVARIVAEGAGKEYAIDPGKGGAHVSTGQVLMEGSEGIAGTVVLVVRKQLANMASRLGQRLVGSILSRLVSVVASGVGVVLIAKDIWDFRHGVLPIVAEEMKAKATKDKVREELAKSIAEQIHDSIKEISDKTAERVVEIWTEFRRAHAKVVDLADRQDGFKRFLGWQPNTRVAVLIFGLFHGFGLATKLQEFELSPNGLVTNIVSFNVGVEIGQGLALTGILIALTWWRSHRAFFDHAFATNALVMACGFLLVGFQLSGYFLS